MKNAIKFPYLGHTHTHTHTHTIPYPVLQRPGEERGGCPGKERSSALVSPAPGCRALGWSTGVVWIPRRPSRNLVFLPLQRATGKARFSPRSQRRPRCVLLPQAVQKTALRPPCFQALATHKTHADPYVSLGATDILTVQTESWSEIHLSRLY